MYENQLAVVVPEGSSRHMALCFVQQWRQIRQPRTPLFKEVPGHPVKKIKNSIWPGSTPASSKKRGAKCFCSLIDCLDSGSLIFKTSPKNVRFSVKLEAHVQTLSVQWQRAVVCLQERATI